MIDKKLLTARNLKTYFYTEEGVVKALDGVNLEIGEGETLGLVGETGCGKSVTALSIMRLIPTPPGRIVDGEILFEGESLLQKTEKEMQKIRGNKISMIFQEPMTSLNPVYTIGEQLSEVFELHQHSSEREAMEKTIEALKLVRMPDPLRIVRQYPHELSGGMRQRAMIAMALSCNPKLLIADEPTTALDVTIQAQILELMKELRKEVGSSILLITHDLGIIAEMCDRVSVMYAGAIVEYADVETLFEVPRHPYTQGLLRCIIKTHEKVEKLSIIPGFVPDLINPPSGCKFHPRCPHASDICKRETPHMFKVEPHHYVGCHLIN